MTAVDLYLSQPFAQHALIAGTLVAITCGLISPLVVTRGMAFAVHGTSVLAFTVTEAAQVVGTLLVLSVAITPAAAAQRLSPSPVVVTGLSMLFALVAADGGILASLASTTVKPSVFVTSFSFAIYVLA